MLKIRKEALYSSMGESLIFFNIVQLMKKFPWNNFFQLVVKNIFDEVLANCEDKAFTKKMLESSGVGASLVEMAKEASFKMDSERMIRNGFMALCVHIANNLQSRTEQAGAETGKNQEDIVVIDYLDQVGEDWRDFVSGELKKSNENNKKTLGGSVNRAGDDEDDKDENNYDVQMEKIMARFTNFNQMLS